jgi:exopolyphosphatase / guanosine-5'-triphosphate,3'-diphosphate pyrophosphatase
MIVASIDVGTNTILLLIADADTSSKEIKVIENLHSIPRIGKGLKPNQPFPEDNMKRMFDVLREYSEIIKKYECKEILLTGTNAFRIASDKDEIIEKIKKNLGLS